MNDYNIQLNQRFATSKVYLKNQGYYMGSNNYLLTVDVKISSKDYIANKFNKVGLGSLVVDLANWLYHEYGFRYSYCPNVKISRASKGIKTITFQYAFTDSEHALFLHKDINNLWAFKELTKNIPVKSKLYIVA